VIIAEHLEENSTRAWLTDAERAEGTGELLAAIRRYAK
jgi:hypothetical protein